MNIFASLEETLSPVGEPKAPVVGLMIEDWDENVTDVAGKLVDMGYAVQTIPKGVSYSGESANNGIVEADPVPKGQVPQVLFYYKGKPEDASDGIPVLVAEDGNVKVSVEGKMKELAEYMGMIKDADDDTSDHEYR
ncbi:hypothetical protein D3C72_298200 [compost metagenome]